MVIFLFHVKEREFENDGNNNEWWGTIYYWFDSMACIIKESENVDRELLR
jgi:hypothetical protein